MADPAPSPSAPPEVGGLLALALSRPHEALAAARSLLADGGDPAAAAIAHQAAGVVLRDFGDMDEALLEFRAAIRCARRARDDEREADVRAAYGVALVMAGHPRGLAEIRRAADVATGAANGRIQIRLAHALWLVGRNADMLRAAQRAVDLLEGSGDLPWEGRAFGHRAKAHLALGAVARADADYARSEQLFAAAGQRLEYASALQDRGTTAFARGDLPAALTFLDDAQQVVDELGVFEPEIDVARVQVLLAAELARDALRVADAAVARSLYLHGSAVRRAELLFAAALAASASGDQETAVARSAEAVRMFRHQQRGWWAGRAELVLLGSRFATDGASPALLRAATRLATTLESVDPSRVPEARLLCGRLALAGGQRVTGVRHLRAAAARRPRDVRARSTGWLARAVLADVEARPGDMLAACRRGLDLIDVHLGTLGATELRAQATAQGDDLARLALAHAVRTGDAHRLLVWSERWRATALTVPPVRSEVEPELTRDLAALRTVARRLEDEPTGAGAATLRREQRRLEDAVRRRALHRPGAGAGTSERLQVTQLRTLLGESELVVLTDVDGQLYAVVLSGDRPATMHHVGGVEAVERALAQTLFALRRQGTRPGGSPLDLAPIGERLQEALLGTAVDALTAQSVVVVPTGRLHAVPWALLPRLADRAVTVAPSAATWMRGQRAATVHDGRVVLVGGPRLSTGAAEVRHLAERYPDAVVLADGEATSERVLAAMDGASLVHVAAHGTFRSDSPLLSALELDDGPLTVYDLERLGRAPHRVVLSSCNSAVGAPSGADELLGVVRALMTYGSVGVVASVVPVDDPATVPFMLELHRLLEDRPLGQALSEARAAVRDDPAARTAADSFIALGG
ncbi:CHAT domain-containing protein [Nocardioides guangzhouensis]|uniref:CHAT domain-containing protein n=1 Tax=Nocardioides guangzhouensis TaxID=2497878 RepID=A0A4Q4ZH91_9ACTN|nr:CHAT domain-containing protein [Nocardioides guangzhouensis]RYP87208.1 CHAT domain-containing protein [Nocardioides guangzhouensis]